MRVADPHIVEKIVEFVDPRKTPFVRPKSRGELPHLYKPGACYFVSYRLADALRPSETRTDPMRSSTTDELSPQELLKAFEPPLAMGACWLNQPAIASLVQNAFLHFNTLSKIQWMLVSVLMQRTGCIAVLVSHSSLHWAGDKSVQALRLHLQPGRAAPQR
jgi:hypothetical protein